MQAPLPDGSLPGTRPYVPAAPGAEPPPNRPPSNLSAVALALSLVLCAGYPMILIGLAIFGGSRGDSFDVMLWSLPVAALVCVGTLVLGVVALLRVRGSGGRTAMAIAAIVLTVLAPFTSIAVFVVCTFLLAGGAGHGRPLRRRDGKPVVTPAVTSGAWATGETPSVGGLDEATRAALAAAWLDDAALEHASIAAFGKLSLELVAIGAPPELVGAAHRAALDEVAHARIAYSFASAYAGVPRGPGALPEAAAVAGRETPSALVARVVFESVIDGMVGESAASALAALVAARTEDPVVARALTRIAREEATHAALARAVVAHCANLDPVAAAEGVRRAQRPLETIVRAPAAPMVDALPGRASAQETVEARRSAAAHVRDELGALGLLALDRAA